MEKIKLTAEVFVDTGKDFRPEDSITTEYECELGEKVRMEFDLTIFEQTVGFRFDPLLEDSSMVKMVGIDLTYDTEETKHVELSRMKTNADVDFEPIYVYLHHDPKFFVDEGLCQHLTKAVVEFEVLDLGMEQKAYWQEIKKSNVSQRDRDQILGKLDAAMTQNRTLTETNRKLKHENEDIYASGIWKLQHDAKGPMKVIMSKANIVTFLAAVYLALCSELFIFNYDYYSLPRPNEYTLVFSFLRFGLIFVGVFAVIMLIRGAVMKGYRHELD